MNFLNKEDILKNKISKELFKDLGKYYIYFLIQENEIVYVGITENLNQRIKDHLGKTRGKIIKVFDSYSYIELEKNKIFKKDLFLMESYYQIILSPKYNLRINNTKIYNKVKHKILK